jgi:WD40-like Beta Propeller Repeat
MRKQLFVFSLLIISCKEKPVSPASLNFDTPQKVNVVGYSGDMMEPFISKDGQTLFFNNLNDPSVNTDIFYSKRVSDTVFQFQGPLKGVNSSSLDAVSTMDTSGTFYFVSTRSYTQTLSTIYTGKLLNDSVGGIALVPNITRNTPGMVNFDVEISASGQNIYFVDGKYNSSGQLITSDLVLATQVGNQFVRSTVGLLDNINSDQSEYAAGLPSDELTLYFTRLSGNASPRIFYSTRSDRTKAFNSPREITAMDGFVEAPSPTADGSLIYYHKMENNHFALYCIRRK